MGQGGEGEPPNGWEDWPELKSVKEACVGKGWTEVEILLMVGSFVALLMLGAGLGLGWLVVMERRERRAGAGVVSRVMRDAAVKEGGAGRRRRRQSTESGLGEGRDASHLRSGMHDEGGGMSGFSELCPNISMLPVTTRSELEVFEKEREEYEEWKLNKTPDSKTNPAAKDAHTHPTAPFNPFAKA